MNSFDLALALLKRRFVRDRAALDEQIAQTREQMQAAREDQALYRILAPEARVDKLIIQQALARLGESYTPATVKPHGARPGGRRKTQFVQFEECHLSEERFWFKLKVNRRVLGAVRSALPYGVRLSKLMSDDTCYELSGAVGRNVTWQFDEKHPEEGAWLIVNRLEGVSGIPRLVRFQEVLPLFPVQEKERLPLVLGIGPHRRAQTIYLDDLSHMLVGGPTNTGKSNIVNGFILTMMHYYEPKDLQLVLIDPKKGVEFGDYERSPFLFEGRIIRTPKEAIMMLRRLQKLMHERLAMLPGSAKKWSIYRKKHPGKEAPYIVAVIDEYAQLVIPWGKKVANQVNSLIMTITAMGRAAGIQVIVCTQYPSAAVIDGKVKINLSNAIGTRCGNPIQSGVLLGQSGAEKLPRDVPGRALLAFGPDLIEYQPAYISPDDTRAILDEVRMKYGELPAPEDEEKVKDETPYEIEPKRTVIQWIQERCILSPESRTNIQDLYEDYDSWGNVDQISKQKFAMELSRHNFKSYESHGSTYRIGIALMNREVEGRGWQELAIAGGGEIG